VRNVLRRQSRYSSSYPIANLRVEMDTGKRLNLVLKDLSPSSLLEEARGVRPEFLYDPLREIEMYRTVLKPERFGTAVWYGALVQKNEERYWLLLERVEGPLLWQAGRFEQWKSAARWLARFHAYFWTHNGKEQVLPQVLLRHDAAYCMRWIGRAERFISHSRNSNSNGLTSQFKRVAKRYSRVVEYVLALPQTVIHGEFYPSNVIVRRQNTASPVCPIDWEVAAQGAGLIDLAALASGTWEADAREALVAAYREELEPLTRELPSMAELLEAVDYCQLYLSVQWLGWAADWSPPRNHEQDWLRESIRLSKRLGL
jgi:Ser/Thr protein kinase RdoA (MazF antagonist)